MMEINQINSSVTKEDTFLSSKEVDLAKIPKNGSAELEKTGFAFLLPTDIDMDDMKHENKEIRGKQLEENHENDIAMEEANEDLDADEGVEALDLDVSQKDTAESTHFKNKTCIELSRCSWHSDKNQHFLKGCIFSPDGTCILAGVNGDGMHIFELPRDLYTNESISAERPVDILTPVIHVKEAGNLYDMVWFPFMNSSNPDTCFWLATRQHEPIQMWDAFNGSLRCSFRGYDNVDELEPALSIAFSYDGEQIFAGYKKSIKIFNTNVPGRDYQTISTKSTASCIAINYLEPSLIAFGSWNRSISILDVKSGEPIAVGSSGKSPEHYHRSGVTHLKFTHNGDILISGARRDEKMLFWDLRNLSQPIHKLQRKVETNQRIFFDLSYDGHWLASGDTTGIVHVWDMLNSYREIQFPIHNDCCNGVSFHPGNRPIMTTTSGQHHFNIAENEDEKIENSLIIWWTGENVSI